MRIEKRENIGSINRFVAGCMSLQQGTFKKVLMYVLLLSAVYSIEYSSKGIMKFINNSTTNLINTFLGGNGISEEQNNKM